MKKSLCFILSLALVIGILSSFPVTAYAASSGTLTDTISYELSDDGVLTISGSGDMPDYTTSLFGTKSPFYKSTEIKEIIIAEGITRIGNGTFRNCSNLTCFTIPEGMTSIGDMAFDKCTSVNKIYWNSDAFEDFSLQPDIFKNIGTKGEELELVFGDSVTRIPENLCSGTGSSVGTTSSNNITSVVIPDSVTSIGEDAFYGSRCLTSVVIPDSVTEIPQNAFSYCSELVSVTLPGTLTDLNGAAFLYCTALEYVFFTGDEEAWAALTDYGADEIPGDTSIFIPILGAAIHYNATYHVYTSFDILEEPSCVETGLKRDYCEYCDFTETLVMDTVDHKYETYAQDPTCYEMGYIEYYCRDCGHYYSEELETLPHEFIDDECWMCGEQKYYYQEWDDGIILETCYSEEIPETINGVPVVEIGMYAFAGNPHITSVTIPDSVTYIGSGAFEYCENLKSVEFGEGIEYVETDAFYGCSSLEHVTFSETNIDDISKYISFYGATVTSSSESNYVGTGDVITVDDGYFKMEFTCIVRNDANGDSACDVIDCAVLERVSSNNQTLDGVYAMAADNNADNKVDINDYQTIVNTALSK